MTLSLINKANLSGSLSAKGGVVLHGDPYDGEPTKWIFSDIARDAFLWKA